MVSRPDLVLLQTAQQGVTTLVERDIEDFFLSLNLARPEAARDALLAYLPELIRAHGLVAASVAADWYDELRAQDGIPGRFRATVIEPKDVDEKVAATVRRAAAHLFTPTPGLMVPALIDPATKYALEPGRDTIAEASIRDPRARGWKRYTRPGSCDFCQMLSMRTYSNRTDHFDAHGHCHCVAAPVWGN